MVSIVMVEDDDGHARLIERMIRRGGMTGELMRFSNGGDALEFLVGPDGSGAVSAGRSMLILLDLNLPDMTGLDILRKLKSNIHTRRSPVVVLTTTEDPDTVRSCYELGANIYMTKPLGQAMDVNPILQLGLFMSIMQVPQAS